MPRKGYRSLTLPENTYQSLIDAASVYGTTAPKLIRMMIANDGKTPQGAPGSRNDGVFHGNCTVQIEGLDRFREWLKVRRGLSDDTLERYMLVLLGSNPSASPEDFLKYSRWRYIAFRNYFHFRYQMGLMTAEEKARWLDLLRIRHGTAQEPPEVREEDVREMMVQPHENIVEVLLSYLT
jgi:hypothetical protein